MSFQLGASEILEQASKIADRNERIIYLRRNALLPVQIILQYALDTNIKWLVSPEMPKFENRDHPIGLETALLAEARRLYLFVEYDNGEQKTKVNLSDAKRQLLWIQMLTMIHMNDVKLLLSCIKKRLPYDNLERDVIKDAFPHLLPVLTEADTEADKDDTVVRAEENRVEQVKEEIIKPSAEKKKAAPKRKGKKVALTNE